jgi:hypothetical protein
VCATAFAAAALAFISATAALGGATVVVAKDFASLCAEADLIFMGTVSDVRSQWSDESQTSIETLVTFSDLESLLGVAEDTLALRFAGGKIDSVREEIAGMPRFAPGQRVFVFARRGHWTNPIVGFHQGLFRIVDSAAGPLVVSETDMRAADAPADAFRAMVSPHPEDGIPLETFVARVREVLGARDRTDR